LRQILINLVGNAMKFTETGEILVEVSFAKEEGDQLTLAFSVQDTGIGIAADKLGQVFEPFRQADASMTRSRGGSGLGLSIVKHLVALTGGEIGLESALGRGSRFHFTARFHRVARADDIPQAGRHISRRLRTLLVDSNAVSARVVSEYLASWKVATKLAETTQKARAAWNKSVAAGRPFDVAIIDLKGFGAEGVELARTIRAEGPTTGCEIILLVGMNNLAGDDGLETLGAFATLTKPARPSALFDCFVSIASGAGRGGIAALGSRRTSRGVAPSFDARVLVVEDNLVNQEVATGILENMDCRVVTAANGARAVELYARETFDLVLMDCEMPVMDGFAAAQRIRAIESARDDTPSVPHLPIVALTAHALAEIREKCLRSGMDDFLVKPFDELQIRDVLRRWIPSRERAPRQKSCAIATLAGDPPAEARAGKVIDLGVVDRIRQIRGKDSTSLFERVVSQFAEAAPSLAAQLRSQCDADDAESVWRTAHSLKSSAAALGAGQLSRRCAEIEALARDAGVQPVRGLLDALEADVAAAQTGLRELIGAEHG
jgi:CheY-like chemotaxis protein/HPt (histidine-containing phosphotransfer) domain-containing protein